MKTDVMVIGAGPAGLSAALAANQGGAGVLLIERESRPGGILKQCIHDGFGIVRYNEKLSGPEYAFCDLEAVKSRNIEILKNTFVLDLKMKDSKFKLLLQNPDKGVFPVTATSLVAATGCRERTSRQVFIHGDRPAGIYSAGTAQNLINIHGYLPGRKCVVLGSGDIGMIMARRLTLEGAEVLGVYEIKSEVSGLTRNLVQCLEDFDIPLYLNSTVTKVHGARRVEGVTVAAVGPDYSPLFGTESYIPCDTLLLSVGLIPENDILEPLGLAMDTSTGGPIVDQQMMTTIPGLFSCGNATHVYDLVDHVSESGATAGSAAAGYCKKDCVQGEIEVKAGDNLLYAVPQRLVPGKDSVVYFRSARTMDNVLLQVEAGEKVLTNKKYIRLRPPEMERLVLEPLPAGLEKVVLSLKEAETDA